MKDGVPGIRRVKSIHGLGCICGRGERKRRIESLGEDSEGRVKVMVKMCSLCQVVNGCCWSHPIVSIRSLKEAREAKKLFGAQWGP